MVEKSKHMPARFPIADTAALGACYFDSTDFSVAADGKVSLLATGNLENLAADSGTVTPAAGSLTLAGGEGIDTSGSGSTITIAGEDASTSNKGVASFASANFSVSSGAVSIANEGVDTAQLKEDTIQQAQVVLTAAQVKALAATQIELVAAPGAGKAIHFLGAALKLNYGSEVFTESDDDLVIKYTNASGVAVSDVVENTGFIDQSADTITFAVPIKDPIVAAASCENQALVIDNDGDGEIGGNASNDSTLTVDVSYRVVTLAAS